MKFIKGHMFLKMINIFLNVFNRKINRTLIYNDKVCEYKYYWERVKI